MRFVVLGIGAVGGTVAARLVEAGEDVLAVARGEHARVVREEGLRLATPDGVLRVGLPVVDDPARLELHDRDVLVLAVKGQHTQALLERLPLRAADLPVLCLQNGVANEPAALRRHRAVHGVSVALPALHTEPGHVAVFIRPSGVLDIGRYPRGSDEVDAAVARRWTAAGLVTRVRDDVMAWKHRKLLSNLGNAVEALTGTGLQGEERDTVRELHRLVLTEGQEVLRAAGRPLVDEDLWRAEVASAWELAEVPGVTRGGGSTWQSLLRGAGSVEADRLNGEVVLAARELGREAPVNELLRREVVDAAAHGLAPGSVPATELLGRVRAVLGSA
ncbi:ketopantoate reductase family protein [Aquipuribacter nitratireducens]|uniref:Ketopantoate reductase family protein n=1 Tax=Aquipuribacter nitratireducens TaxID=650104 RepID=A0ABW0GPT8_9MICO